MRRYELMIILILTALIGHSWRQMHAPTIPEDGLTLTQADLAAISPWEGPIGQARAAASGTSAESKATVDAKVLGASSDQLPPTLLPIEKYTAPVFLYTLQDMLDHLDLTVAAEDVVHAFPDPALGIGSTITIYRATPVEVTDWGKKKSYRTWQGKVADFLQEQGIELGDNDRVDPKPTSSFTLKNGAASLVITRVAVTEVKVKEKIDFKVIEKEDPELLRGKTSVTPGSAGERVKTFRVTRENGVEVKRELLANEVVKEAKNELRVVGTKVMVGKTHTGRASWYSYKSTKVATDLFKRGTNLRITNLNNGKVIFVKNDGCICADTGYVVDLHPDHFRALGGILGMGVLQSVKVEEILN